MLFGAVLLAQQMGLIDFAGGTAVEICSGFAALALALVIGRRAGFGEHALEPHNIPIALLGAALLWFGWFGFNAGSALALNSSAVMAFVNTNSAAAAGALAPAARHPRPRPAGAPTRPRP